MKKIITVLGARPQFIKAATVSRAIADKKEHLREIIIHTGQHFDKEMSEIFFQEMDIPAPHYRLNINGLGHGAMTGQMMEKIEEILISEKPDFVLVYGDTNSTLAGALAASKLHINVVHVEAGLRSFNMKMPEEINRILTDRISNFLFCPTETAIKNLKNEGFDNFSAKIHNVGDVMYDAVNYYQTKTSPNPLFDFEYVLCTVHRAENTDDSERLTSIVTALNEINTEIPVIMPLHPRTRNLLINLGIKIEFKTIDPVGYFDMLNLLKYSTIVMTDSGGLQKEAYLFNKYCITLRDETEWVELVDSKVNFLVGAEIDTIMKTYHSVKKMKNTSFESNLYGDATAAQKIVNILLDSI